MPFLCSNRSCTNYATYSISWDGRLYEERAKYCNHHLDMRIAQLTERKMKYFAFKISDLINNTVVTNIIYNGHPLL